MVECCCLASLPTLEMTRQLLLFARTRLTAAEPGRPGTAADVSQRQLLALGATLHRLETFMMMQGAAGGEWQMELETDRIQASVFLWSDISHICTIFPEFFSSFNCLFLLLSIFVLF